MQRDNLKKKKEKKTKEELSNHLQHIVVEKINRNKIFIQQSFKSCLRVQSLKKKKKTSSVIAPIESKC